MYKTIEEIERLDEIMNLKAIRKIFIVSMAVAMLLSTVSARAYAIGKKSAAVDEQKDNSQYAQKKKREKEYAKWKIEKVSGAYYYKQKSVRFLVDDTGKKTVTYNFYYNKKGKVDIRIIRNKKGKIKRVKYISKKKAEEMRNHCNTAYCMEKR